MNVIASKVPRSVIARERSDRSNLTIFRTLKNDEIAAVPLVARNDAGMDWISRP
ncbi:protein of unknown function [Candidatus Methylomirabilis oxygeniifera]|uniref:Uncharacterized protein n=1 Tax=Methylomirabilis oxygeniifera TaxID=671143 RepID=D5MN42_METO1|nr:protein of unknown function [Candidatus Methylomirabilis oxyfera]